MILCCSDMAKLLEAKEECARRGEEAVSTAAFKALALAPTIGTLLSVSKALRLIAVEQELSYSAVLVLPVLCCLLSQWQKLPMIGLQHIGGTVFWHKSPHHSCS